VHGHFSRGGKRDPYDFLYVTVYRPPIQIIQLWDGAQGLRIRFIVSDPPILLVQIKMRNRAEIREFIVEPPRISISGNAKVQGTSPNAQVRRFSSSLRFLEENEANERVGVATGGKIEACIRLVRWTEKDKLMVKEK